MTVSKVGSRSLTKSVRRNTLLRARRTGLVFDRIGEGDKKTRRLTFDQLKDGDEAFVAIPVVSCLLVCWGGGVVYKGNDQIKRHEWLIKRKNLTQEMSEGPFSMEGMNE